MFKWVDRIEEILIKTFLVLFVCVILIQYIIQHPRWADILVLINRLEGISYGGL